MTRYAHIAARTPQHLQADPRQVPNSAGGYTFQLDCWKALDRWLILGAEGGTYYATEEKLTLDNVQTVRECLRQDGKRTVRRIVEISQAGRAPKNDPAIFALALAASDELVDTRVAALQALPVVCRTGTHLFQFAESVNTMRGWGRGLVSAVADWYQKKTDRDLAYQLLKYRQRGGWSHRDLLRLAHPKPKTEERKGLYRYVTQGDASGAGAYVQRFEALKHASPAAAVELIDEYGFTHEMIPDELKSDPKVWRALTRRMPYGALVRNLGKLASLGLLKPLSEDASFVLAKLSDPVLIQGSRIHPIAILKALLTYASGHGFRGALRWEVNQQVCQVLEKAFYVSFRNVQPSGKRTLIALDVSGSMDGGMIAGVPGLTPRVAAAAMAMVTMRTEKDWHAVGFSYAIVPLRIHARMSLPEVVATVSAVRMGSTDCAAPFLYAEGNDLDVEAFQVWTDNETHSGRVHPHQALKRYRQSRYTRKDATLAVIGCTATRFTIADPSDPGMFDVVGFDTATPNLLASFARGWQ